MTTDPPAELLGEYDIVHVRLITLVIKDNNALPIVRNLRKLLSKMSLAIPSPSARQSSMLESGGYLQSDEVDTVGTYIRSANPSVSNTAIDSLFMKLTIPKSARGRDEYVIQPLNLSRNTETFRRS
jgi:hypothetical protein